MGPLSISALACVLMLGGAAVGVQLRHALPQHHLNGPTKELVTAGTSLIAAILAVVLGLLIDSARSSFDGQRNELRRLASDLILLDHLLDAHGPDARPIRVLMRRGLDQLVHHIWLEGPHDPTPEIGPGSIAGQVYFAIHGLPSANEVQRSLKEHAVKVSIEIARARAMIIQQAQEGTPYVLVGVLVFWFVVLFMSFCLFTPVNATGAAALFVIALSASAALLLYLEMTLAFSGFISIPSRSLSVVLPPLI